MYITKCPECGSKNITYNEHRGECLCRNCGLVIEDAMPSFSEYTEGNSTSKPQAVNGKIVKEGWLLSTRRKNLNRARKSINRIADRLSLPAYTKKQAYNLYEKATHKDLCVGRNKTSIIYACIYAVCNFNGIPKTAEEMIEYSGITKKQLLKAYSLLQKELGIKTIVYEAMDILPRFITKLKLSQKCLTKAFELYDKIKDNSLCSGKNPKSIASALIYISAKLCKEKITQRAIANQMGIMEVTIRKRYKEIAKCLNLHL